MPTSLLKWFDMLPTAGILFILVMALSGSDRRPLVSSFSLSLSTGRTSTMLSATQKATMPQMEPPFADIAGRKKKSKLPIFDKRIPAPVDQYMQAMREKEAARHEPHYLETVEVRKHPRLLNGIRMRRLPRSDLVVSEIGLGTLTFGEQVLTDKAHSMLDYAVKDFGLNLIDTSEMFPGPYKESTAGKADRIVGAWLSKQSPATRDGLVISAKVCGYSDQIDWIRGTHPVTGVPCGTRVTRSEILKAVDDTLSRLHIDRIDLFQLHWPARYVPLNGDYRYDRAMEIEREKALASEREEELDVEGQLLLMQELIQSGKIRAYGLSNETPYGIGALTMLARCKSLPLPVSVQCPFSMLEKQLVQRDIAEAASPSHVLCQGKEEKDTSHIGVIAYSPLAGGSLSGKYTVLGSLSPVDLDDCRLTKYLGFQYRYISKEALTVTRNLKEMSVRYDIPMSVLALSWVYQRPYLTSTLLGATTMEQLEDNILALNLLPLDECVEEDLDRTMKEFADPVRNVFEIDHSLLPIPDLGEMPWGVREHIPVSDSIKKVMEQFGYEKEEYGDAVSDEKLLEDDEDDYEEGLTVDTGTRRGRPAGSSRGTGRSRPKREHDDDGGAIADLARGGDD